MNPIVEHGLYNLVPLGVAVVFAAAFVRARRSPLWSDALRRLARDRSARVALAILLPYALIGLCDSIGWYDRSVDSRRTVVDALFERPAERTYSAPGGRVTVGEAHSRTLGAPGAHLLGTDALGRDVVYRTLKGVRTAFVVGGLTSLLATPIALALGLLAGYRGRWIDDVITYVYTVVSSVPAILLQIVLVLVLGKGLVQTCAALGATVWVNQCRLVRGETLKHRDRDYVRAARALGASDSAILIRHILPNLMPAVVVTLTLGFSGLVLSEAILTYLGIGLGPESGSWGNMIDGARSELARDPMIWWNFASASFALFVLVLACNLLGDAVRDAIDPRLRGSA